MISSHFTDASRWRTRPARRVRSALTILLIALTTAFAGCRSGGLIATSPLPHTETPHAENRAVSAESPLEAPKSRSHRRSEAATAVYEIPEIVTASEPPPASPFPDPQSVSPSIYRLTTSPFDPSLDRATAHAENRPNTFPVRLASFTPEAAPNFADGTGESPFLTDDIAIDESPIFAPTIRMQFRNDVRDFVPGVWDDTRAIVNWHNGAWILGATGIALALRADADDNVRDWTAEHPRRWGDGTKVLGELGDVKWQVPVLLAVYGKSVWTEDVPLYDFSRSMISAYTITGLSTVVFKGITNTERPSDDWNNGEFGFPSFHTSSSFTIAAVVEEYYGMKTAAPAYVLAGLIGWSRIDERDHDLSDVVFGAMLGYIVGKSVAAYHLSDDPRVRIRPTYSDVNETYGVMFETAY